MSTHNMFLWCDSNEYPQHTCMFLWRTDKILSFNYHQILSLSVLLYSLIFCNVLYGPRQAIICIIWTASPRRAAKVQASLRIRAVSPEPSLLAHTSSQSSGTFRQKARSLAPLNSWACADKICHDGMLEDTNSLDGAHMMSDMLFFTISVQYYFTAVYVYTEQHKFSMRKLKDIL